jgi:uncharacterized protein YecT (DUF1311 family)
MKSAALWLCAASALALSACHKATPPEPPVAAKTTPTAATDAAATPDSPAAKTAASAPSKKPAPDGKAAAAQQVQPRPGHDAARRAAADQNSTSVRSATYRTSGDVKLYSAEYRACLTGANGYTAQTADCYSTELTRQGARLNRAYQSALDARSGATRARLEQAQHDWVEQRDSNCQEDTSAGARSILHEGSCRLDMTIRRAIELEHMTG